MPMSYREHPLPPPLDAVVDCVWLLSQPGSATAAADVQRIPPDGSIELIFHLGNRFEQLASARTRQQPAAFVVGVWTKPIELRPPACFDTVGIRIRPGCGSAFWREPASTLTNDAIDATSLLGPDAWSLRDRLGDASDDRARVAAVSDFLRARLRERRRTTASSIDRIVRTRGRLSIDAVARDAGIGHRQLERAFRDEVGVSPKTFSRIVRFQHVLRHAQPETAGAWADVAAACGYTDQSHLIRDFTQFAGETPAQLAAADAELADYFRRR